MDFVIYHHCEVYSQYTKMSFGYVAVSNFTMDLEMNGSSTTELMKILDPTNLSGSVMFIFRMLVILYIFAIGLYIIEDALMKVLQSYDYTDIHEETIEKGHYTRQINIMSAVMTGLLAFSSLVENGIPYISDKCECDDIRKYDVEKHAWPIILALSYFAYDSIFHKLTLIYYVHHFFGFFPVIVFLITKNSYGIYFSIALLLTEWSSLFLNLSYTVSDRIKKFLQCVFFLTFILVRPVYMTTILKKIYECPPQIFIEYVGVASVVLLYVMNLYWCILLIRKMYCECLKNKGTFDVAKKQE